MKRTLLAKQECMCCGFEFYVKYYVEGGSAGYEYVDDNDCGCECGFTPLSEVPSISQWLESIGYYEVKNDKS